MSSKAQVSSLRFAPSQTRPSHLLSYGGLLTAALWPRNWPGTQGKHDRYLARMERASSSFSFTAFSVSLTSAREGLMTGIAHRPGLLILVNLEARETEHLQIIRGFLFLSSLMEHHDQH